MVALTMTKALQWNAVDYAQNSSGQLALGQELIGKLELESHHNVLDIGCGDGKITHRLAEVAYAGKVVGVDLSSEMIAHAQQTHQRANLQFICLDATNIDLQQTFDRVFSNAVLHWVHDQPAVLRSVRNLLSPDGSLLFQLGGEGNAAELIATIQAVQQSPNWRHYFQQFQFPYLFPSVADYSWWLQETGFAAQRVELLDRNMVYSSRADFIGWLRSAWFPMAVPIPMQQQHLFWQAVSHSFLGDTFSDGNISVAMKRLEVQARVQC